jgi:hypothetical protein
MTQQKHFKKLVRARMKKTGEAYTSARRQLVKNAPASSGASALVCHRSGRIAATTALGALLRHHDISNPVTKKPFSEAMLFGLAGGIGMGVFQFYYAKEEFASFFIAGRHQWWDDLAYLQTACDRLGVNTVVKAASGTGPAEKNLRELLKTGPVIAWVDAASLPHRAMPAIYSGGAYHVVTVYSIDDAASVALIGDLTAKPFAIPLKDLTAARLRIKKYNAQLLGITRDRPILDLARLIRAGLAACHQGLVKQRMKNFTLLGLNTWGERLQGSKDKESWERVFTPGARLWGGLTSIYEYIEHNGTGGGLCRPIFAEFLREAGEGLGERALSSLAPRYADLGRLWSELAAAALPESVPLFKKAKILIAKKADLLSSGAPAEEVRASWDELGTLRKEAQACFPLTAEQSAGLRRELQQLVFKTYEAETAAHAELGKCLA